MPEPQLVLARDLQHPDVTNASRLADLAEADARSVRSQNRGAPLALGLAALEIGAIDAEQFGTHLRDPAGMGGHCAGSCWPLGDAHGAPAAMADRANPITRSRAARPLPATPGAFGLPFSLHTGKHTYHGARSQA